MFKTIEDPTAPKGRRIVRVGDAPAENPAPPVEAPDGLSREVIAEMDKDAVRELLDTHGAEYDARLGVDKLRALAIETIFVEL